MTSPFSWTLRITLALALVLLITAVSGRGQTELSLSLTDEELAWVGQQVYRNECAARRVCLVHWNQGEAFPSLGIGHFIWYPAAVDGPFTESFPGLVRFMAAEGADLPDWLAAMAPESEDFRAPWPDRDAFLAVQADDPRVADLRLFLEEHQSLQAAFLFRRASLALERVVAAAQAPDEVRARIQALSRTPGGVYVLIDYVNFKGEGLAPGERYQGQGWGLLQVLETMAEVEGATELDRFRESAARVLTRRAMNAEAAIERERWLPGWLNRLQTYREPPV